MSHFVDAMDQSGVDETLEQEHVQHEQQEQNAATRMATMERMIRDMQAQRLADQQLIADMQQAQQDNHNTIHQHAATINNLRNNLQQQLNNPPVVAPPVAPAVAPAVAPIVAPMVPAPANDTEPELGKILKPEPPAKFDGDTGKLRKFLDELRTYFEYYFPRTFAEDKWDQRIRYAGTRMEGAAADWFNTIIKDRRNHLDDQTELTKEIFKGYKNFEDQLEKSFGITNEAQEAEKKLRDLKQKGPCYKHTSTFIQLLSKVNWTEDSKKEMYYYSLKPEVKDEIYKIDRQTVSFTDLTQEAIKIDNRQWERKQERKTEKSGHPHKHQPQANQGKKRDDYVAKDNGTRPGRMDIDAINHKRFSGTCNACGKKGHKEADCRSKITCGFCGKKGHDEAHCYTKKNAKKSETTKDKVQIDAITEVPHNHLSWTACYNDSCLVHQSSKEGSGYYPKKSRARKSHETVRIDTLNFYDQVPSEKEDSDLGPDCENCGSYGPLHECAAPPLSPNNYENDLDDECSQCGIIAWQHAPECRRYMHEDECPRCQKRTFNNNWTGCQFCQPEEWQPPHEKLDCICQKCNPKGLFHGRNDLPHDYRCSKYEPQKIEYPEYQVTPYGINNTPSAFKELLQKHIRNPHTYKCNLCESEDLDHDCNGCKTCGSRDREHDCSKTLDALVREHRRQEEQRQYLKEHPSVHIMLLKHKPMTIIEAHHVLNLPADYPPSQSGIAERELDAYCGKKNWMLCDSQYCGPHALDKLKDWHYQETENQRIKEECTKEHFLDCMDEYCTKHVMKRHRFRLLTKKLTEKGYNTITHENKGQGNKALIKEFHSMIEERIYDIKCKWCYEYQGKTWRESHLGRINIDSIGKTKKLQVEGYINQHPVTTYVDSGADRNLITPQMVNLLGLPYAKKKQPTYVSSVATPDAEATINYETDHLPITIAGHTETIKFDIMPLGTHDVLLGHPWLKQGNPLINWKTGQILWETDVTQEL